MFNSLIALALAVWLLSCGASLLALYWNIVAAGQRLRAALISSCVALLVGGLGVSLIQLKASKTVNGQVAWSFDSRWFFIGALVLAGASLALTLWNWRKASSRLAPGSQAGEAGGRFGDEPLAAPNGGPAVPPANPGAGGGPPSVS
jgi:protein-S-isoprenylcysteine O-methyltransferase Ste14